MLVRTFQRLVRVDKLYTDGRLLGDWSLVVPGYEPAYRGMVAAMARAGVDTGGRPPIWGWHGRLTLGDAAMLFNAEHELSLGFATLDLAAPDELVVRSDYGAWNDYMSDVFEGKPAEWDPAGRPAQVPAQICLPFLLAEWVLAVRPLPTSGWEDLDWSLPA
ncbi:hypothetical protein [Pseudonocardia sp. TRM90224]|uniref:hypothetical protein n=1 Tax=Pseudonocardia sp. TRM90224 TaxID=2812678 RepID=UPI001E4C5F44|nr:hypothetical protein [Pseudonocardia sp. TRM90224]